MYIIKIAKDRHFAPTKNVCTTKNTRMKIIFTSAKTDFAKLVLSKALTNFVPQESSEITLAKPRILVQNNQPLVESAVAVDHITPSSSIQSVAILTAIREKRSWQEVKNIKDSACNTRKISDEKIRQKKMLPSKGISFEGEEYL